MDGREIYLAKVQAERKGKPGRPSTTGDYLARAEAQKAFSDEKEREIKLEIESRTYNMAETLKILKKSRLNPQDTAEEAHYSPRQISGARSGRRKQR